MLRRNWLPSLNLRDINERSFSYFLPILSVFSFKVLKKCQKGPVPDTASFTSEDECKWYWHQMIYFPETINTISTMNTMSPTHSLVSSWAMHVNLLCACWHLEAMKGSSSLTSCRLLILSRLSSSLIWAQLTLLIPAWGTRSPSLQDGAPIHRVRAHSLTGIRNRAKHFFSVKQLSWVFKEAYIFC